MGEILGGITSDTTSAIAGEMGHKPRLVPVSITVNGSNKPKVQYRMNMVHDRLLSPLLLQMMVYSTIDATERTLGSGSVVLKGRVDFESGADALRIDNVFAGDYNVPLQASLSTAMPVAYALQNSLDNLRLKAIELNIEALPDKKQSSIEQVWSSTRAASPGELLEISVLLASEGGREVTKTVPFTVPMGAKPGPLFFTAADGPNTNAAQQRYLSVTQPLKGERMVSF